jgi:hypothetical protein
VGLPTHKSVQSWYNSKVLDHSTPTLAPPGNLSDAEFLHETEVPLWPSRESPLRPALAAFRLGLVTAMARLPYPSPSSRYATRLAGGSYSGTFLTAALTAAII